MPPKSRKLPPPTPTPLNQRDIVNRLINSSSGSSTSASESEAEPHGSNRDRKAALVYQYSKNDFTIIQDASTKLSAEELVVGKDALIRLYGPDLVRIRIISIGDNPTITNVEKLKLKAQFKIEERQRNAAANVAANAVANTAGQRVVEPPPIAASPESCTTPQISHQIQPTWTPTTPLTRLQQTHTISSQNTPPCASTSHDNLHHSTPTSEQEADRPYALGMGFMYPDEALLFEPSILADDVHNDENEDYNAADEEMAWAPDEQNNENQSFGDDDDDDEQESVLKEVQPNAVHSGTAATAEKVRNPRTTSTKMWTPVPHMPMLQIPPEKAFDFRMLLLHKKNVNLQAYEEIKKYAAWCKIEEERKAADLPPQPKSTQPKKRVNRPQHPGKALFEAILDIVFDVEFLVGVNWAGTKRAGSAKVGLTPQQKDLVKAAAACSVAMCKRMKMTEPSFNLSANFNTYANNKVSNINSGAGLYDLTKPGKPRVPKRKLEYENILL